MTQSHLAQAIGHAAIQQGHKVLYREAHVLLDGLAEATRNGTRRNHLAELATVPLVVIDDLGMRKMPATAPEGGVEPPGDLEDSAQHRDRELGHLGSVEWSIDGHAPYLVSSEQR
jgi:hypothetical protein